MNDELELLKSALAAMQTELETMRKEIQGLRRVVQISENENGMSVATIECQYLNVRCVQNPALLAVSIGQDEQGGDMRLWGFEKQGSNRMAMHMHVQPGHVPHMELRGPVGKMKALLQVNESGAIIAAMGPDEGGIAYLKGHPRGAVSAVSNGQQQTQGALHYHAAIPDGEGARAPATELIMNESQGRNVMRLHGAAEGCWMRMGPPDVKPTVVIHGTGQGTGISFDSPDQQHHAFIGVLDSGSEFWLGHGDDVTPGTSVRMAADARSTLITMSRPDGTPCASIRGEPGLTGVDLSRKDGTAALALRHSDRGLSRIFAGGTEMKPAFGVSCTPEVTMTEVRSPTDPDTLLAGCVGGEVPILTLTDHGNTAVSLACKDGFGSVSAYGTQGNECGYATLAGGPVAGGVGLNTADGTQLLSLHANAHGGNLSINNELGFPRITAGVYQESSGLFLNHTGTKGVDLVAGEKGGVVAAFDPEGELAATLPDSWHDAEDDD